MTASILRLSGADLVTVGWSAEVGRGGQADRVRRIRRGEYRRNLKVRSEMLHGGDDRRVEGVLLSVQNGDSQVKLWDTRVDKLIAEGCFLGNVHSVFLLLDEKWIFKVKE